MRRTFVLPILILIVALAISACGRIGASAPVSASNPYGGYEIDPIFWSFFNRNGGVEVFGRVLTTVITDSAGFKLQYLESGLLVYDPGENRFYFAALGLDSNLGEPPEAEATQRGDLLINGYRVHPGLSKFYLKLGRELVGAPISNPRYNYAKNRLEQHFENLGLFYQLDDPEQTPHLLAYGLLACGDACQKYPEHIPNKPEDTVVLSGENGPIPYYISSNNIPDELIGDPVKELVLRTDGSTENIYEHMAFVERNGKVSVKPIPQMLGHSGAELFAQIDNPRMVFYTIQDNFGHNVLDVFNTFILDNGGYVVSGDPTTEIFSVNLETEVIRQCFTNYCLDYYPKAFEAQVRPVRLGPEYFDRIASEIIPGPETTPAEFSTSPRSPDPFSLHVWKNRTSFNASTPPTISAMVFSEGVAQSGQNLELYLYMPDGTQQVFYLPTTNEDGQTGITIPPVSGENGTRIQYQICLAIEGQEPICVKDAFLLWGNP